MPPPLADPEPFFDLGKSPLLELSLLLRDLVAFFLVAPAAPDLFPRRLPRPA